MKGRIVLPGIVVLALALGSARAEAPQGPTWQGKMEKKEGLTIASNPKSSLFRLDALTLKEDLSIGAAQGGKDYAFFHAASIEVDDGGNIYVMDQGDACIKVYAENGKYLRSIGRKGQGPGELQNPNTIHLIGDDRLVFEDFYRGLNIFTREGKFISFVPTSDFIDVLVTPENRVVARVNAIKSDLKGKEIRVYDGKLNLRKALLFIPEEPRDPQIIKPFAGLFDWALSQGDRVAISFKDDYEIDVLSLQGGSNLRIKRDFDRVKITKEEIDAMQNWIRGRKADIPEYHPALQGIWADDEGRFYAKTYERTKDNNSFYYDIFDREGRYLAKVPIPRAIAPRVWKNNSMYGLEEDSEGFQMVKRFSVRWHLPN
jgi:hypothetical protein